METLTWLLSLSTTGILMNWVIIAWTSFRFHRALELQKDPLLTEPYAWRSFLWPLAPVWLMLTSLFLLAGCVTIGYKVIFRTSYRQLRKADHGTGRHTITPDEMNELDRYYSMPRWRRFMTYVQFW